MKQTIQQLEAEARAEELLRQKKEQYPYQLTADHAERLAQVVPGSYYTNPEITASLGLSNIPIDASQVHINSQKQALNANEALQNRNELVDSSQQKANNDSQYFSLVDLLQMSNED